MVPGYKNSAMCLGQCLNTPWNKCGHFLVVNSCILHYFAACQTTYIGPGYKPFAVCCWQCLDTPSGKYGHFLVINDCIWHAFGLFYGQVSRLGCRTFCRVSRTVHEYSVEWTRTLLTNICLHLASFCGICYADFMGFGYNNSFLCLGQYMNTPGSKPWLLL